MKYLKQLQETDQQVNPLFNKLCISIKKLSAESVILELPTDPGLVQGGGVIAGGIQATLADEAMAHLVLANLAENEFTSTIEMNIRYLNPARQGKLSAEASLIKRGKRIIHTSCEVKDESGILTASAGASFIVTGQGK